MVGKSCGATCEAFWCYCISSGRDRSGGIAGEFIVGSDYRVCVSAQVIECVGITSQPENDPCYVLLT